MKLTIELPDRLVEKLDKYLKLNPKANLKDIAIEALEHKLASTADKSVYLDVSPRNRSRQQPNPLDRYF
jgi:hypothetical protein